LLLGKNINLASMRPEPVKYGTQTVVHCTFSNQFPDEVIQPETRINPPQAAAGSVGDNAGIGLD
jgi:hypothetical protein